MLSFARETPVDPDAPERATVAAALRASALRLEGGRGEADLAALEAAREVGAQHLLERLDDPALRDDDDALAGALRATFEVRLLAYLTVQVATLAQVAAGARPPQAQRPWRAIRGLAAEHASVRSVWLRNSVRGAIGLAAAVLVAQLTTVQHEFWVVLGALSVLRSSALSTGATIVSALAGTTAGIVAGGLLVVALGRDPALLWVALPFAIGLAAYAPRAISFAAGQAAFTVAVLVLFNLIVPSGWEVGLVRIEDVAMGFAIALGVGLLFWPRGAMGALREAVSVAYAQAAAHTAAAFDHLFTGGAGAPVRALEGEAIGAERRLDAAFRQALAERGAARLALVPASRLVAGVTRLRRTADALGVMAARVDGAPRPAVTAHALPGQAAELHGWYASFAAALRAGVPPPSYRPRDDDGMAVVLAGVREAAGGGDTPRIAAALVTAWGNGHLGGLWRMEGRLVRAAGQLDDGDRAPAG